MWDEGHTRLVTGERVVAVDAAARTATTSGGLVLPWPGAGVPALVRLNGKPAVLENGELRIRALPARVEMATR